MQRAIGQLETSLAYCQSNEAARDAKLAEIFRSAAIQAFEFTYELSHKVLRRYLVATEPTMQETDKLSFPELIRLGYDRGVVTAEWKVWAEFRRLRSLTSHTYHAAHAAEVFDAIPTFLTEVRHMLSAMQKAPAP